MAETRELQLILRLKDEVTAGLKNAGSAVRGVGGNMDVAAGASRKFGLGLLAGVAAAGAFVVQGLKTAGNLESIRQGFVTLLGSAEKADKTMKRIKEEAARTPFEIEGLSRATQLLASVTNDGDKAIDVLLDVGEALAAMGKGQAELDRIIINLQQIGAVGKASMIDIKQFAFAGIPIFAMLKEETGLAGTALNDFISNGGVSFEFLTQMFEKATAEGGRFAGAFANQMGTFNQILSNARDAFSIFLADFVNSAGIMDGVKNAIKGITELITKYGDNIIALSKAIASNNTIMQVLAGVILGALAPAVILATASFVKMLISLLPFIVAGGALALLIRGIKDGDYVLAGLSATILTLVIPSMFALAKAAVMSLVPAFTAIGIAAAPLLIGGVIIGGIVAGVVYLIRNWEKFKEKTSTIWSSVESTVVGAIKAMLAWLFPLARAVSSVMQALGISVDGMKEKVGGAFRNMGTVVGESMSKIGSSISTGIQSTIGDLTLFSTNLLENIVDVDELDKIVSKTAQTVTELGSAGAGAGAAMSDAGKETIDAWTKVKETLASVSKELEDMIAKRAELLTDNARAETDMRQEVAQAYVDQEQKVLDLKKDVEAKKLDLLRATSIADGQRASAELQRLTEQLRAEESSLNQRKQIETAYRTEISDIRRFAALTEFDQTLELIGKKQIINGIEFQGKLAQMDAELTAKQLQHVQLIALEKSLSEQAIAYSKKTTDTIGGQVDGLIKKYNDMYNAAARAFSVGGIVSINQTRLPGRAGGGPVSAGASYVVGERGPEIFTPTRSGNITPNGAGGVVVNVYGDVSGTELIRRVEEALMGTLKMQGRVAL